MSDENPGAHEHQGGSSGWQAPEQLIARDGVLVRQTRSMDIFSLGCVLHYCITGGRHPFGESYERDSNILHQQPNLTHLTHQPEALNLLHAMLNKDAVARPSMLSVLAHPLWWTPEQQLQFLIDISDRVENEDREPDQSLLTALEAFSQPAIGNNWGRHVHPELVANLGRHRRYDYTKLRDLLRVIRNKRSHFREMPVQLQDMLGKLPQGFLRYFTSRFPNLFISVYVFAMQQLGQDPVLAHYWPCGISVCEPFLLSFLMTNMVRTQSQQQLQQQGTVRVAAGTSGSQLGDASAILNVAELMDPAAWTRLLVSGGAEVDLGARDRLGGASPVASTSSTQVIVGYETVADFGNSVQTSVLEFPVRPDKQTCEFYQKTGHCKFGESCVFNHPPEYAVALTAMGLPLRPEQPVCAFYLKHNSCKYGPACRWHHPHLKPVYAGTGQQAGGES